MRVTQKKTKKKLNPVPEDKDDTDEEQTFKVDAIVAVKKSRMKGSGGFLLLIKWNGYEESENTWEPMQDMLNGWNCKRHLIYSFFRKNKIDVTKCDDFDFIKGTMKKQASTKNDNLESSPKTKSKGHHSKNQECHKISHYRSGFICDASHEVLDGNLKEETVGTNADKPNFLYGMKCKICCTNFVGTKESSLKDQYKVSQNNPCYVCGKNTACTYYVCGKCYKAEIVMGDKPKRKRI